LILKNQHFKTNFANDTHAIKQKPDATEKC